MTGKLVIFSGPSGVGKDSLLEKWIQKNPRVRRVVACTTRAPRAGEVDGVDYHFVSSAEFDRMAAAGEFLEHKIVHGFGYATPLANMNQMIADGLITILKIDVQGALEVMDKRRDVISIFIMPPSLEELERRIRDRRTDSDAQIALRLTNAHDELAVADRYQFRVVNDDLSRAVDELETIMREATA